MRDVPVRRHIATSSSSRSSTRRPSDDAAASAGSDTTRHRPAVCRKARRTASGRGPVRDRMGRLTAVGVHKAWLPSDPFRTSLTVAGRVLRRGAATGAARSREALPDHALERLADADAARPGRTGPIGRERGGAGRADAAAGTGAVRARGELVAGGVVEQAGVRTQVAGPADAPFERGEYAFRVQGPEGRAGVRAVLERPVVEGADGPEGRGAWTIVFLDVGTHDRAGGTVVTLVEDKPPVVGRGPARAHARSERTLRHREPAAAPPPRATRRRPDFSKSACQFLAWLSGVPRRKKAAGAMEAPRPEEAGIERRASAQLAGQPIDGRVELAGGLVGARGEFAADAGDQVPRGSRRAGPDR